MATGMLNLVRRVVPTRLPLFNHMGDARLLIDRDLLDGRHRVAHVLREPLDKHVLAAHLGLRLAHDCVHRVEACQSVLDVRFP